MSDEIQVIVADEGENFLGWKVERTGDGWHCRIWVLLQYDDESVDASSLSIPRTAPDFEETLATEAQAIDYLASEDMMLRTTATQLLAELSAK